MKCSTVAMLWAAILAPVALAGPLSVKEVCACEPLQTPEYASSTFSNSLAACNRVARSLEKWRTSASKDYQTSQDNVEYRALKMSKNLGIESTSVRERASLELLGSRTRAQMKMDMVKRSVSASNNLLEKREAATYMRSADRFRIVCQPAPPPELTSFAPSLQWAVITFLMMALLWLCIFEVAIDLYIRLAGLFQGSKSETRIVLGGSEKVLLASVAEEEEPQSL